MKKASTPHPKETASPMEVEVKIHALRTDGKVLANASVNINGCFAVRGVRIMDGPKGPFVSMPSYKSGGEYKDICFPCTSEFHQQFHQAVLDAYQQQLAQFQGQSQADSWSPEMGM